MTTYKLEVTPEELALLAAGLNELPRKHSQPLFLRLQKQVEDQDKAAEAAEKEKP